MIRAKKLMLLISLSLISSISSANWIYESSVDKMNGKTEKTAAITSDKSLSLEFPYTGRNHGFVTVRQSPQYGLDVYISVEKGQILCHRNNCEILVRFDDAPPIKFNGLPPADSSSTVAFIQDSKKFINLAKKSKKILVQMSFYRQGAHILEFTSKEELKWELPQAKKSKK